jgi:hypothetical protein
MLDVIFFSNEPDRPFMWPIGQRPLGLPAPDQRLNHFVARDRQIDHEPLVWSSGPIAGLPGRHLQPPAYPGKIEVVK